MRVNISSEGLNEELIGRILDRFNQDAMTGHWTWTGSKNDAGLPVITVSRGPGLKGSKTIQVRRFIYEYLIRALIHGERVMRHCDEPLCIAPLHMRAMTTTQINEMTGALRQKRVRR